MNYKKLYNNYINSLTTSLGIAVQLLINTDI